MIIREVRLSFIYLSKLCFFYANKLDKTFDNPILNISKLLFVGLGVIIMAICQLISLVVLVLLTFYISWVQLLNLSLLVGRAPSGAHRLKQCNFPEMWVYIYIRSQVSTCLHWKGQAFTITSTMASTSTWTMAFRDCLLRQFRRFAVWCLKADSDVAFYRYKYDVRSMVLSS